MLKAFFILLPLVLNSVPSYAASQIEVRSPWLREIPKVSTVTAVYMVIENKGDEDDRLVGVSTDVSNFAEIHITSVDEEGVARMRKLEAVDIPSGKTVELKEGAYHIMLIGIKKPLNAGDRVELDLAFEKYGAIKIQAEVKGTQSHRSVHHH